MGGCVGACVSSWYFCVLFGYWLYFVKFTYMYACMHLLVCARIGVRACVRICVYVYAYLCNVCVWGAGEGGGGGWGGGGGVGWSLCAHSYTYMLLWMFAFINLFCFPVCVY